MRDATLKEWAKDPAVRADVGGAILALFARVEAAEAKLAELSTSERCPLCNGSGKTLVPSFVDSSKQIQVMCSACRGEGILGTCPRCAAAESREKALRERIKTLEAALTDAAGKETP